MPLHPVIQAALAAAVGQPPYHALPIDQARAKARSAYPPSAEPVPVGAVRDIAIAGAGGPIALRLYTPPTSAGTGPHPVLVFFHGSGFVMLDLDTHDDICRRLCIGAGCIVVSVDYRLAPEHRFPAAPDDCLAATRWVAAHAPEFGADPGRIALAGDSAGGCLAAVTALRIRDEGGPALRGLLLYYPVLDHPTVPTASYRAFGTGFGLTHDGMRWFWDHYLSEPAAASHPHASPLRADTLAGLPSACVLTAEYDVLHDEGEAFAQRLREADVAVVARSYAGMNHGFLKYTGVIDTADTADTAMADGCDWLRGVFGGVLVSAKNARSRIA